MVEVVQLQPQALTNPGCWTDKIVVVVDPEGLFDLVRRSAVFGLRTHETRVAEGSF